MSSYSSPQPSAAAPDVSSSNAFRLCVFFGHHKCATGWTGGTLRELALHMGRTYRVVNQTRDFAGSASLGDFVNKQGIEVLTYANANLEHARSLPAHRGFHVVRDPRDVLVSAYFSHKKTHGTANWPELIEHRERLQSLSKFDGLMAEMEFSAPFFEDMRSWDYQQDHVLELRMEDVTASPVEFFLEIAEFLGILRREELSGVGLAAHRLLTKSNRMNHRGRRFMPGRFPMFPVLKQPIHELAPAVVTEIARNRTFEKLTGRSRGQENRNTHLRKGVPGDWKNHFEPEHVAAFKDRYNDLVLDLGYASSPDW